MRIARLQCSISWMRISIAKMQSYSALPRSIHEGFAMKLYFSPAACSLAVHIALREAGLPVDLASVDLATHRLVDGSDYLAINPRGYVPVLELDDGSRHSEASA